MTDEPVEEFEPEQVKEAVALEPPMRFFTSRELEQMYRENQDEIPPPAAPETFYEAVFRCLTSYREWF